jgi:hypothetical protein|tara:strand:+ start:513 stop:821 length:309 start_codon:yes stop_codon:yes gene_type:complete
MFDREVNLFDEAPEISFDKQDNVSNRMEMPPETQDNISSIVDNGKAALVKDSTKEMLKGAVLGSVLGAILSLWRKKSVWMGVLAGGLAGGYIAKESIINLKK